jgi:DNA-binding CsgD family transcriptional regulator
MQQIHSAHAANVLQFAQGNLGDFVETQEYHHNLLLGLRKVVGCDGALIRLGSQWTDASTYYLEPDTRFTDNYVKQAEVYRPEVAKWCDLTKGTQAVIDTEVYSSTERRKIGLYADVIQPAGVKSILACPLALHGNVVALIFLYRTGRTRPFQAHQATGLDPFLPGLALAELALAQRPRKSKALAAAAAIPPNLRPVFDLLLTGKRESEIAAASGLAPRTVHKYVELIYRILCVNSRAQFMARVFEQTRLQSRQRG